MKKLCFLFFLVIFVTFLCSCGVKKVNQSEKGNTIPPKKSVQREKNTKDDKIVIGIDKSKFSEDFVEALSNENDLETEIKKFGSLEDAMLAVQNGEVKMYLGNFPKESKNTIGFCVSAPYLKGCTSVVTLTEEYSCNKGNDVAGYIENSAQELLVGNYFSNSKGYKNIYALMNALSKKEISCAFVNTADFKKSSYFENGYFENDSYSYSLVAIYNQNDVELAKEFDVYLAKLKASGEADELSEKYFGENLILK